jgi:hypothetical protein
MARRQRGDAFRVLEGGCSRQHEHLIGRRQRQQLGIEGTPGRELTAAHEG